MNYEEWVADLRSNDWYKQPGPETTGDEHNTYFNLSPESSESEPGSFLVDHDWETNHVFPGISYQINDDGGTFSEFGEKNPWWWKETATPVPKLALGKWLSLHGFCEPVLPDAKLREPQETWVLINGGWMWTPGSSENAFRHYLARSINVEDSALWWLASTLTTVNLGLAVVPVAGKLTTYELGSLDIALAQPTEIVERFSPCEDYRRIGIGRHSYSFSFSGADPLDPGMLEAEYSRTLSFVNKPMSSAKELLDFLESCTEAFDEVNAGPPTDPDALQIREYLQGRAEEHFAKLAEAGYALALIPLGGKTIWVPEGYQRVSSS